MSFVVLYITNPSEEIAEKIANHLLEKRLVVCVNIFPVKSMYWWKGGIEKGKEFVIIAKTLEERYEEIKEELRKIHPYEIPCIIKIPATANDEYLKWVEREVKK